MRTRAFSRAILASLLVAAAAGFGGSACARRTFDVKVIEPIPPEAIGSSGSTGQLATRLAPMWDEDWQLETFDANVTMSGVLIVRADFENPSADSVPLRRLRVSVVDGNGRVWRPIDGSKARKKIEKFYGVRLRFKEGDRLYREDFAKNVLDMKTELPAGGSRQGLLFFEMPKDVRRAVPVTITAVDGSVPRAVTSGPVRH